MNKIFGYIYYKYARFYKRYEGKDYYMTPIVLLSLCQTFNFFTLLPLLVKFNMNNWIYCIIYAFLFILNVFYFLTSCKREQYERKWSKENKRQKRLGSIWAILYIIISFVGYLGTMQFYGKYTRWEWAVDWIWRWW